MQQNRLSHNTCAKKIRFTLTGNVVTNVEFLEGGCPENLQTLRRLVEGMTVEEIEKKIGEIICRRRETSCADQLAKTVRKAYNESKRSA